MAAPDGVLDLVRRWTAAEQQNDAGLLRGLLADDFAGAASSAPPACAATTPAR